MIMKSVLTYLSLVFTLGIICPNFAQGAEMSGKKFRRFYFVQEAEKSESRPEFLQAEKLVSLPKVIVRTDKAKWKEDLSRLLRHKYSSYTFPSFECIISAGISLDLLSSANAFPVRLPGRPERVTHLPGYYSFLHRLCPF